MIITVKDFEEYDYVVFTDKRPRYWNDRGRMDYLLGAKIPIEELKILGKDGIKRKDQGLINRRQYLTFKYYIII